VVATHLKNICEVGSFPELGVKIISKTTTQYKVLQGIIYQFFCDVYMRNTNIGQTQNNVFFARKPQWA